MHHSIWLLLTLLAFASACAPPLRASETVAEDLSTEPAHPVRFVRPFEEGQTYAYAALGSSHESTVVSWAGGILEKQEKDCQCEFAAVATIREIDTSGMPVRITYRIHRFRMKRGGEESDLVGAGSEIAMAVTSEGVLFSMGGLEVNPSLREALSLVLKRPDHEDDTIFGTPRERRPGDRWPVRKEVVLDRFRANGVAVDPEKLGALVTFRQLERVRGTDCMKLDVEMKAADAGPVLPEGFEITSGSLEVLMSGTFPLDATTPPLEESTEFLMQSEARGRAGDQTLKVKTEIARTFRSSMSRFGI